MAARASQLYFCFIFDEFCHLGRLQFTCTVLQTKFCGINLNPWLRYYYFQCLKTDVRDVGILLLVSIVTFVSSLACHSASAYQISSKASEL